MRAYFTTKELLQSIFLLYAFTLPLSRAGVAIATALIVILFFFSQEFKSSLRQLWENRATQAILLFLLFLFASLLREPVEQRGEGFVYLLPFLYLLPALVAFVLLEKKTLILMLPALLLGIFVSEIISYGIYFDLWEKKNILLVDPSPFMHHIQYSTFLAFGLIVALYKILHQNPWSHKLLYGLFVLSSLGTLFLIKGRTGQVAFLMSLFVLVFISFENRLRATAITLLLSVLLLFGAYRLSDTFQERITMAQSDITNMIENNNYATSLGYRVGVTLLSADLVIEHPLFGLGVVDAMPTVCKAAAMEFPDDYFLQRAKHLQNQYLQIVVEFGLVGLFLFGMMLYQIARIPIASAEYATMKISLMVIYLLTMLSDVQLHIQFTAGLFAIIVGVLLALSRIEQESRHA